MDPIILAFAVAILAAGLLASRLLPTEAQRDPRLTIALIGGVMASGLLIGVVLILTR